MFTRKFDLNTDKEIIYKIRNYIGEKQMNNGLISVIVPVYNAGKYFNNCINSIVNQTYKNLEIIIVDDGSTDSSPEICDKWAEKDSRIKVIHKENSGASSARNTGIDSAKGDYIAFVDADDRIELDMYEIMLNEIIENNADAARCGIDRVSDDGSVDDWGTGNYDIKIADTHQIMKDVGEGFGLVPVSIVNKLIKKKCIADIRFDTRYKFSEDTLFNFMVAGNIKKMVYHDVNRYHYTFNMSSITSKGISENNFDEHRVMDVIFSMAAEDVLPFCIKGDVLKSFRTIRQMILADEYMDRFSAVRKRIVSHKKEILSLPIYSKLTKLRTLLLWLCPSGYKFVIRHIR